MNKDKALKLALKSLQTFQLKGFAAKTPSDVLDCVDAINAINKALAQQPAIKQNLTTEQPAQPQQKPVAPDMIWNQDDTETAYNSIEEFLNHKICNGCLAVGEVLTLLQAKKFPSVKIKVISIDENEYEAEYEIIEAANSTKE